MNYFQILAVILAVFIAFLFGMGLQLAFDMKALREVDDENEKLFKNNQKLESELEKASSVEVIEIRDDRQPSEDYFKKF